MMPDGQYQQKVRFILSKFEYSALHALWLLPWLLSG